MTSTTITMIYFILILGKEFHAEPIAVPGPSSGIMLQNTTDFILTNKRISSQKSDGSRNPRISSERRFDIPKTRSPEDEDMISNTRRLLPRMGTWKDNIHIRVQTPDIVAFQPWEPDWLDIPILDNCVTFRDNNFQCEGDPFNYDATNALCGLKYEKHGSEKCHVTMSKIEEGNVVNAVLMQDKWFVSTRLPNMTVFSKHHVMMKVMALPSRVSLIKVPHHSRITIGNRTLYPVEMENIEGEVESIDAFQNQEITINPDLKFLLDNKPSHTVQMVIRKNNVTMDTAQYSALDNAILNPSIWAWRTDYVWGMLTVIILGWLSLLTIKVIRWIQFIRKTLAKFWLEHYKLSLDAQILEEIV